MKVLELFAGEQCFSKVASSRGHETFTTDIKPLKGIDYVVSIFGFLVNRVPFVPDVIWASIDCKTWSIAAGNTHTVVILRNRPIFSPMIYNGKPCHVVLEGRIVAHTSREYKKYRNRNKKQLRQIR